MMLMQALSMLAICAWAIVLLASATAVLRGLSWKPLPGDADRVIDFMLAGGVMALSSMVLFYPETARAMTSNETSWRASIYLGLAFVGVRIAWVGRSNGRG